MNSYIFMVTYLSHQNKAAWSLSISYFI